MKLQCTKGSKNPRSKLTESEVKHIRSSVKNGVKRREIAALFGVSRKTIDSIMQHVHWLGVK